MDFFVITTCRIIRFSTFLHICKLLGIWQRNAFIHFEEKHTSWFLTLNHVLEAAQKSLLFHILANKFDISLAYDTYNNLLR